MGILGGAKSSSAKENCSGWGNKFSVSKKKTEIKLKVGVGECAT
jgi:hypothetical protein